MGVNYVDRYVYLKVIRIHQKCAAILTDSDATVSHISLISHNNFLDHYNCDVFAINVVY